MLTQYYSEQPNNFQHDILFQSDPFQQCPDSHKPSARNWTCCKLCNALSARHLAGCIYFNARIMTGNYRFAATVNIHTEQSATDARSTWAKATRKLRQSGVVALWTREVSPATNRLHYHSVLRSEHELADLKHIFRNALNHVPHDTHIRRYTGHHWPAYICKGRGYSQQAVLFRPNTGLKKHGTIGQFWHVPLSEIRAALKQRSDEHREINATLRNSPELFRLANHIARDLLGQTVAPDRVRYLVGKWANTDAIQDWIQSRKDQT